MYLLNYSVYKPPDSWKATHKSFLDNSRTSGVSPTFQQVRPHFCPEAGGPSVVSAALPVNSAFHEQGPGKPQIANVDLAMSLHRPLQRRAWPSRRRWWQTAVLGKRHICLMVCAFRFHIWQYYHFRTVQYRMCKASSLCTASLKHCTCTALQLFVLTV